MSKRKIYFRADASADIGYGHFVRTLALADMLKDDFECIFITQSPTEYQRSEVSKVCALVEVPATDEKFGMFLEMLQGDEIVVLDNYFYDTDYQRAIKDKGCKLVCIDDMHDKHYVADVVINHGLRDKALFDTEVYTRLCLGLDWALLRKPFLNVQRLEKRETGHWLIAFGGVDFYDLSLKFAEKLQVLPEINKITVIVGDGYKNASRLDCSEKITVLKNLSAKRIADLFWSVEGAVLPSSTIAIEAVACGCPVISGFYVDNQKEIYHSLITQRRIWGIGDLLSSKVDFNFLRIFRNPVKLENSTFTSGISSRYINLFKQIAE